MFSIDIVIVTMSMTMTCICFAGWPRLLLCRSIPPHPTKKTRLPPQPNSKPPSCKEGGSCY